MTSQLINYFRDRVLLDLRTLSLFRVLLAATLAADLCLHGVIPASASGQNAGLLQVPALQFAGCFVLLFSLCTFAIGYKTRWSAFFLWITFSVFHVGSGTDSHHVSLCALLLFSLVLPVSRYVSLDDAMDRGAVPDGEWRSELNDQRSVAMAGVLIFALFCFCMMIVRAFGTASSNQLMPVFALILIVSSVLPRTLDNFRFVVVACSAAGAVLTGFYELWQGDRAIEAWLLTVLSVLLLPGSGWSTLDDGGTFRSRHGIRIFYDEPCGFCRKICFIFASFFMLGRCRIATAQSSDVAHKLLRENDSWVVFDAHDRFELHWAAVLLVLRESPVWGPVGWILTRIGMGSWGEPIYRLIGRSRTALSKITTWLIPYSRYRISLHGYEKWLTGVWCLLLLSHYSGLLNVAGLQVPDAAAWFGFDPDID